VFTTPYAHGFETCDAGWTLSGDWECGIVPDGGVGPGFAYEGANAIATRLATNYSNTDGGWGISLADSPTLSLTGTAPTLTFRVWYHTEGSSYDGFNIKVGVAAAYSLVTAVVPAYPLTIAGQPAWGGNQSAAGWQLYRADLTAFAGQQVGLRFAFRSDTSGTFAGVYVDAVNVGEANAVPLSIVTTTLPNALVPSPYSQTLVRSGGSAAATWSIVGGTNIAWLSINPMTGVLSGTPMASQVGPASVIVRITEPGNPTNFAERTFPLAVVQQAVVSSLAVTGLPTGFTPAWSVSVSGGNIFFPITDWTGLTASTANANRNGIGSVSTMGGAYTPAYAHNQVNMLPDAGNAAIDPQVIFHSGTNLYAYSGLFAASSIRGPTGVFQITGPTAATPLTVPGAPFGIGSRHGWASNASNFYLAHFTPSPYDIIGANVTVTAAVPFTNVTNLGTFSGPHGVAASATRLYVFDASSIRIYQLDMALPPSVPMITPAPVNVFATTAPCGIGSSRTVGVVNNPTAATRLYYVNWGTNAGSTSSAVNRICEVALDSNGYPTGPITIAAGPATAVSGSADGPATAATFENIMGLTFDTTGNRIYVVQKSNSVAPTNLIRVIALP